MEEGVPTVAVNGVASRFVSQTDIEAARTRKQEQWKAAYARCFTCGPHPVAVAHVVFSRLGQEPPPQPVEDSFDGRSLAEVGSTVILVSDLHADIFLETGCQQGTLIPCYHFSV